MKTLQAWLTNKWRLVTNQEAIVNAYVGIPSDVIQHLLDNVYCTVCESNDPIALAAHNAQRALVHEMLRNIDYAQNPSKYRVNALLEQQPYNGVQA